MSHALICLISASFTAVLFPASAAIAADPSPTPTASASPLTTAMSRAEKTTKKGLRQMKDEACELINGKLECAPQKLKHKAQDIKDEMDTH